MTENRPDSSMVTAWMQRLVDDNTESIAASRIAHYGVAIGSVIEKHRMLPRAMEYARQKIIKTAVSGKPYGSGTVILADQLSESKGRFARAWHAPPGGIWGCMVSENTLHPHSSRFIPFAVGLACCETLRQLGCDGARIRWVNDVLANDKKIAGFLVETFYEPVSKKEHVLVGFGININNDVFPPELSKTAASLQSILGYPLDITAVTAQFLARFGWYFGVLRHEEQRKLKGEDFSGTEGRHLLLEKWLNNSDTIGQRVCYGFDVMQSPQYKAVVKAVNDDGGLVMELEDGSKKTEYSGEIRYIG